MSAHRLIKQLLYGIFWIVFFGAWIATFYFIWVKPAPTCFDAIKNQNEENVDCGGVCSRICPNHIRPLVVVGEVKLFTGPLTPTGLVARIQNPNEGYALTRLPYTFRVHGEGNCPDTADCAGPYFDITQESFIHTSEVKYLTFLGTVKYPENFGRPMRAEVILPSEDLEWAVQGKFTRPAVSVAQLTYAQTDQEVRLSGVLANEDRIAFNQLKVFALFMDGYDQIVGLGQSYVDRIEANGRTGFDIVHPTVPSAVLSSTQVFVEVVVPGSN